MGNADRLNNVREMIRDTEMEVERNEIIIEYLNRDGLSLFNTDNVVDLKDENALLQKQLKAYRIQESKLLNSLWESRAAAHGERGNRRVDKSTAELREMMDRR